MNIWIIFIGFMTLSWIVSMILKSKFKKYSKIPVDSGLSGRDVAERMLRDNGRSISSAAIAAHECGHAVQHARAYAWLSNAGITSYQNQDKAQDALKWAAYTYVVAALGSLATLLYYIMVFTGGRDD